MYRSKDWKNPYMHRDGRADYNRLQLNTPDIVFEQGADAMLEALKKSEGRHRILPQDNDYLSNLYPEQIGYLVFIPDEEWI